MDLIHFFVVAKLRIERLDAAYGEVKNSLKLVQTKLVKWKSRRDFTRETLYIDYVCHGEQMRFL